MQSHVMLSSAIHEPYRAPARAERTRGKLTGTGVLLFIAGLSVVGSGFAVLRPAVFGLRLQPYLIPLLLAAPFLLVSRLQRFPANTLLGVVAFCAIYIFSTLSNGFYSSETPKILSAMVVIVVAALAVQSRADFIAGTLGLSIAIAVLSVRGLGGEGDATAAAMDLTNKNSFSLFALPSMLIGCTVALNFPARQWIKALLVLSAVVAAATIFAGQNRSGYLGAAVVGLMLMKERKVFGLLLVALIATLVVATVIRLGAANIAQARLERTIEGTVNEDDIRMKLFWTSVAIGIEHPILGVSPEGLKVELARRVAPQLPYIDTHNVFAAVMGGCGLIGFLTLAYTAWTICNLKPRDEVLMEKRAAYRQTRSLARMVVVLWGVRGFFTSEILYNPSFCLALGMVIGLCLVDGGHLDRTRATSLPRHPNLQPAC